MFFLEPAKGIVTHQPRGDETRTRILAAAAECFTRAGYDGTGVAEICAHAGVSKGAFYHHFPSKQTAFLALFDQWIHGLDATMQATRAPGASAPQRLEGLAGMVEHVFDAAAGQIPMFLEFWRQAAGIRRSGRPPSNLIAASDPRLLRW